VSHRKQLLSVLCVVVLGTFLVWTGSATFAEGKKDRKKKEGAKAEEESKSVWPSPLDPGIYDPVFKELPFGKDKEEFLTALHSRFQKQLEPVLRATIDPRERDGLKEKMERTFTEVTDSYVELDGTKAGYAVSVIAGEYLDHSGEALFKYAYSDNASYFFLSGNKLWKQFLCSQAEVDFASLLITLATAYGDPAEIEYEDEEKTVPINATWKDTVFELRAGAPEGIFVCSRLVWTYLPAMEGVEELRKKASENKTEGSDSDRLLQQVISDPGEEDPNVLDKILEKKKKEKEKEKEKDQ